MPPIHFWGNSSSISNQFLAYSVLERALQALATFPEELCAPELPGVNPRGRPQKSGGDSKAI